MSAASDLPIHAFPSTTAFAAFLSCEHASLSGIYLKLAKKCSGIPSITAAGAVEVALCYGWIDGRANSIDDKWWTVRYTPRRAKSIWSQKNVGTIARLISEGRMKPAGLAAVDAAKADGRWDRAYAGPAGMAAPMDFEEALKAEPAAEACFASLNKTKRYEVLIQLATCSEKNRMRKIGKLVEMLAVDIGAGAVKGKRKETQEPRVKKSSAIKRGAGGRGSEPGSQLEDRPKREGLRKRA